MEIQTCLSPIRYLLYKYEEFLSLYIYCEGIWLHLYLLLFNSIAFLFRLIGPYKKRNQTFT